MALPCNTAGARSGAVQHCWSSQRWCYCNSSRRCVALCSAVAARYGDVQQRAGAGCGVVQCCAALLELTVALCSSALELIAALCSSALELAVALCNAV